MVQLQQHARLFVGADLLFVQAPPIAVTPALDRNSCPSPVDQHVAHRNRRERQEVGSVAPLRPGLVHEPEVRLVYQRRRGERSAAVATGNTSMCNRPQFLVNERQQAVQRLAPAAAQRGLDIGAVSR